MNENWPKMVARYRDTRNSLMEFRCICRRVAAFLVVKCLPFAAAIHMVLLDVLLEKRAVHSTCVAINKQQKKLDAGGGRTVRSAGNMSLYTMRNSDILQPTQNVEFYFATKIISALGKAINCESAYCAILWWIENYVNASARLRMDLRWRNRWTVKMHAYN